MSNCPVCGHVDGACNPGKVSERQIITSEGVITRSGRERVPMIRGKIGKASYVGVPSGRVELYDPRVPNIRFVSGEEDLSEELTGDGSGEALSPIDQAAAASERTSPAVLSDAAPKPRRTRKKAE